MATIHRHRRQRFRPARVRRIAAATKKMATKGQPRQPLVVNNGDYHSRLQSRGPTSSYTATGIVYRSLFHGALVAEDPIISPVDSSAISTPKILKGNHGIEGAVESMSTHDIYDLGTCTKGTQ